MTNPNPEPTVRWVLFSWRGRLGRKSYLWAAALLLIAQIYLFTTAAGLDANLESHMMPLGFSSIALWLVSAWALFAMTIKRLHDIDWSPKLAIAIFLPLVSLIFLVAMMMIPGSQQTNAHGPPPFPKDKQ